MTLNRSEEVETTMNQTNNERDVVLDVQNLQVSFHTYAGEVKAVR